MTAASEFVRQFAPAPWMADAACRGLTDLFFPERGGDAVKQAAHAKAICAGCPVRTECLDHAIATGERWGIWGGLTADERRPGRLRDIVEVRRREAS